MSERGHRRGRGQGDALWRELSLLRGGSPRFYAIVSSSAPSGEGLPQFIASVSINQQSELTSEALGLCDAQTNHGPQLHTRLQAVGEAAMLQTHTRGTWQEVRVEGHPSSANPPGRRRAGSLSVSKQLG